MKVVLVCQRVERLDAKRYRCVFRQFPRGTDLIEADMDCPTIPGERYNVLLRGVFPGYAENRCCVSDVLSFTCRETLKAISCTEENDAVEAEKSGT